MDSEAFRLEERDIEELSPDHLVDLAGAENLPIHAEFFPIPGEGLLELLAVALTAAALASGTSTRDADALAWAIESLGIHLETYSGWDAAFVRMTVPTERLDEAAALFADVVRRPTFPEDEITRLREQQLAGILQRRKQPGTLAGDTAARTIFTPDVPYSRPLVGTTSSVRALGRDDVTAYYAARYAPMGAALVVVGDIDRAAARDLAERCFGDWTGPDVVRRDYPATGAIDHFR